MYTCYMVGKGNFDFMDVSIDKISLTIPCIVLRNIHNINLIIHVCAPVNIII